MEQAKELVKVIRNHLEDLNREKRFKWQHDDTSITHSLSAAKPRPGRRSGIRMVNLLSRPIPPAADDAKS